jgi:hypothetical protein
MWTTERSRGDGAVLDSARCRTEFGTLSTNGESSRWVIGVIMIMPFLALAGKPGQRRVFGLRASLYAVDSSVEVSTSRKIARDGNSASHHAVDIAPACCVS